MGDLDGEWVRENHGVNMIGTVIISVLVRCFNRFGLQLGGQVLQQVQLQHEPLPQLGQESGCVTGLCQDMKAWLQIGFVLTEGH